MAVTDVVAFLRQRLKEGYTLDSLRKYLLQQRVAPQDITAAMNIVRNETPRSHSVGKILALSLFGLGTIAAMIAVWIFFIPAGDAPKNIELRTALLSTSYESEKPLELSIQLYGENLAPSESVGLSYSVVDKTKNKVVFYKTETLSFSGDRDEVRLLTLPENTGAGDFVLRTKAVAVGKEFTSSFDFSMRLPEDYSPVDTQSNDERKETVPAQLLILPDQEITFVEAKKPTLPVGTQIENLARPTA